MRKTIAIIEDNADNRLLARTMLADDYQVVEFEDGTGGLAGLLAAPPDLVLLDVSLPGLDGTEVVRQIRANPILRHLPVIALTAHAMAGDRERLLEAGFTDYVAKPILDENDLLKPIATALAGTTPASA